MSLLILYFDYLSTFSVEILSSLLFLLGIWLIEFIFRLEKKPERIRLSD